MIIVLSVCQRDDDILRASTDAELTAPEANTAGNIIVGATSLVRAESALIDMFRDPRNGPNLSVMGMTTELEVNLLTLSLIQMIRLMIEQDAVFRMVGLLHQNTQRITSEVSTVIASYDAEIANSDTGILQQPDTSILIELSRTRLSAIILMVANAGIDRCFQSSELLMHLLFDYRSHATIDDVACDEDQVRLLSIDQIHPTAQLVPTIVIADMQVAHRHNLQGLAELFFCGQMQLLAMLVLIMQVAIQE